MKLTYERTHGPYCTHLWEIHDDTGTYRGSIQRLANPGIDGQYRLVINARIIGDFPNKGGAERVAKVIIAAHDAPHEAE